MEKLTKDQFISYCIGKDTMCLREKKEDLKNLFVNGYGQEVKDDMCPDGYITYEIYKYRVCSTAERIYFLEKNLADAPQGYEKDWEHYQQAE